MSEFDDDETNEPQQSFLRRYRVGIIVISLLIVGVICLARMAANGGSSRHESITLVSLAPPPPPPPPQFTPPPPPPQQEEQRMEQPMIKEDQPKAEPPKDEPPLGTNIKGDGPGDSFGLGSNPGNGRIGSGGNGSKWGWYASQVSSRIQAALQQNRKTRSASMNIRVRVWPDPTGRITRAQIAGSTGDPALDSAVDEALTGLQLQEAPPAGMPAPIVLQVAARRPR
jgi:TonB family protein